MWPFPSKEKVNNEQRITNIHASIELMYEKHKLLERKLADIDLRLDTHETHIRQVRGHVNRKIYKDEDKEEQKPKMGILGWGNPHNTQG